MWHEQLLAYAGWLVTNREFIAEVAELRAIEVKFFPVDET